MLAVPEDDPNLLIFYGFRGIKKTYFFSEVNLNTPSVEPSTSTALVPGIKSIKLLPQDGSQSYRLIAGAASSLYIVEYTPQQVASKFSILATLSVVVEGRLRGFMSRKHSRPGSHALNVELACRARTDFSRCAYLHRWTARVY